MEKKHLFIGLVSALGVVSVTFISLFVWKSVSSGNTPEPKPQVVEHFVSFESYGGGHFPTQRVKDGETATPPAEEPIRGKDDFLGWFTDFDQPAYTFKEKVTEDITLYAGWKVAPNVDTYHFKFTGTNCSINGYKNEPFEITLPKGTQTQFQINPEDGYLFPTNDENHFKVIKGSIEGYDATKGLIKIGNMSGDIEIEASAVLPTAESFVNDPWDLFTSYLDGKTFSEISGESSPYHEEFISKEGKTTGTFVGLSRTLTFVNEKGQPIVCNALVVDENPDAGANDNKFTFMITDLGLVTTFAEINNFYPDSYINSYLDILLWMFPTEVKQHMQTDSIDCYNPATGETEGLSTSLYIPSASQIFGEDTSKYPTENSQFAYFANSEHRDVLNGAWLRTPDQETKGLSLYVNDSANIDGDSITATHKLMPVFVIK